MSYQESAEPLSFKQKAKRIAIISSYIIVFVAGGFVIPKVYEGFRLFFPEQKAYVAPLSDYEKSVNEHMARASNIKMCRTIAELEVSNELAKKYTANFDELSPLVNSKITQLNGDISDEVATATIALEKAQGRR